MATYRIPMLHWMAPNTYAHTWWQHKQDLIFTKTNKKDIKLGGIHVEIMGRVEEERGVYCQVQRKLHFLQILVVRRKPSFLRNLWSWILSPKRSHFLITHRRDKGPSVVPISTPKCMLASRIPQYHQFLLHIPESMLACWLFWAILPSHLP